jgi:hypothetical protein
MTRSSRRTVTVLLCIATMALGGCTQRIGDLTFVSTRNIDLSDAQLDVRQGRRVKGEDCKIWPLGLIPTGIPTLQAAVDDALDKGNGNVMVDQVTYSSGFYFILASRQCIQAEGTVLQTGG